MLEDNLLKMKEMNKKGEEEGSSVMGIIIALLIALVVIIIIIYFLFNNGSWDFFKNLPGNKYNKTDKEVVLSPDQNLLVDYYKVAVIQDGKYIKFCTEGDCNKLKNSNLYWYGTEGNAGIYVDKNWAFDKKIGEVSGGKIKINTEVLSGGNLYIKVQSLLPSYEDLINLDNSIYISGIIYRGKKMVVNPADKIFGSVFFRISKDTPDFGNMLMSIGTNDVFVGDIEYSFGDIKATAFQFERNNNEFIVFVDYKDKDGKQQTHQLDCNKKGWVGKKLAILNVKATLKETIDENCKW